MIDTPESAEAQYRELLLHRSGDERLKMACELFGVARSLMFARLIAVRPELTLAELGPLVLDWTYRGDLSLDELRRVADLLRDRA